MITFVMAHEDRFMDWKGALDSLQGLHREGAEVIFLNLTGEPLQIEKGKADRTEELPGTSLYAAYQQILPEISGEYVQFLTTAMLCVHGSAEGYHLERFETERIAVMAAAVSYNKEKPASGEELLIDLREEEAGAPFSFHNLIFRTEAVRRIGFRTDRAYLAGEELAWRSLLENPRLLKQGNIVWISRQPMMTDRATYPHAQKKDWYTEGIEVMLSLMTPGKKPARWLQFTAFELLKLQFTYNLNTQDKHVFSDDLEDYFHLCGSLLVRIDDDILMNVEKKKNGKITNPLKLCFLRIKYGKDLQQTYQPSKQGYTICCQGLPLEEVTNQKVCIDVMEPEPEGLRIEASFMNLAADPGFVLKAYLGREEIKLTDTVRYGQTRYFGWEVHKRRTFTLLLPREKLFAQKKNALGFYCIYRKRRMPLTIETSRFPAKINSGLGASYWHYERCLVFLNKSQQKLVFSRYSRWKHVAKELRLLPQILRESEKVFLTRLAYWVTAPAFRNRHIWITFDKLYKGGDNGEYFYRYAASQNDGPEVYYLINRKYPDAERLVKEGYHPLYFGTLKQKLYFLHAELVAATHANIPVFSGIPPKGFFMTADLFHGDVVCIQHGLAVQQLEHNLNQQYDNLKRFYFASKYEIQNLAQPIYGYRNQKETFRLTGVPRYDGLIHRDKRQILIIPTWRAYISMPTSIGNVRPYSPTFRDTVYFQIYNRLISDPKLVKAAKAYGYRLIYLLHPTIASQIGDFTPGEQVEVLSPVGADYEKLLTESSLMITDYSGVQFDFAYMRKPILYYHPHELPPHYEEGGFFYDTMGFGEICRTHEELAGRLVAYMADECRMKPEYIARASEFFAFDDQGSCQRIYEDLLAFWRDRQKNGGRD